MHAKFLQSIAMHMRTVLAPYTDIRSCPAPFIKSDTTALLVCFSLLKLYCHADQTRQCYTSSSEVYPCGSGRQLYCDAMISP